MISRNVVHYFLVSAFITGLIFIITKFFIIDLIKEVLKLDDEIQALAQELYQQKSLLVMGRGFQFATCLEGALVYNQFSFIILLQHFEECC